MRNMESLTEALRGGAEGMIGDMSANHGRPWGFPLDEIKTKVHLWFCEFDRSVPPAMGKYLNDAIPDCEAKFVSGAGHLWILDHLDEVINVLVKERETSVVFRSAKIAKTQLSRSERRP